MFKESEAAEFKKAFRLSKNDLGMRPIFHQEEHRVQAHIFVAAMQTAQSASAWTTCFNQCYTALTKIAVFKGKQIRRFWDEATEKWYFSVYEKKGYPGEWIEKRLRGIAVRQKRGRLKVVNRIICATSNRLEIV